MLTHMFPQDLSPRSRIVPVKLRPSSFQKLLSLAPHWLNNGPFPSKPWFQIEPYQVLIFSTLNRDSVGISKIDMLWLSTESSYGAWKSSSPLPPMVKMGEWPSEYLTWLCRIEHSRPIENPSVIGKGKARSQGSEQRQENNGERCLCPTMGSM